MLKVLYFEGIPSAGVFRTSLDFTNLPEGFFDEKKKKKFELQILSGVPPYLQAVTTDMGATVTIIVDIITMVSHSCFYTKLKHFLH